MYQKDIGCQSRENVNQSVPKHTVIGTHEDYIRHIESSIDDDVLEKLPKTFQILSSLLARVREMDPKA